MHVKKEDVQHDLLLSVIVALAIIFAVGIAEPAAAPSPILIP